jgi:DNA-binding response OmpR family regulator
MPSRILLVEDDASLRRIFTRVLVAAGYDVLAAGSPSEALALADDCAWDVALLLADVGLPEMSGPQLADRVGVAHADLPVLLMSGDESTAGWRPVLAKPFSAAELLSAVALHAA